MISIWFGVCFCVFPLYNQNNSLSSASNHMNEGHRERQNNYYYYKTANEENSYAYPSNGHFQNYQELRSAPEIRFTHLDSPTTKYVSKIIESGYIVGPPVAYTSQPSLPANFHAFSTTKSSNIPVLADTSNHHSRDVSLRNSRMVIGPSKMIVYAPPMPQTHQIIQNEKLNYSIAQQQPSIIVHHPPTHNQVEMVPKMQYDRCWTECKNWETKYNELYLKYMNAAQNQGRGEDYELMKEENKRLQQRVRQLESRERAATDRLQSNFKDLVEKYKESTLKECYLLVDRYRLECKRNER